jgi:hypothetical protein
MEKKAKYLIRRVSRMLNNPQQLQPHLPIIASIPIDLYESEQGKFFTGEAEGLDFGGGTSAWAGLFNPPDSGVNLFVWAFGITDVVNTAYRIQIWFNASFPGVPQVSNFVSPTNTAIRPLPVSKVKLEYATRVSGDPTGGIKAFVRRGEPGVTIFSIEDGKFIFPPGGSFVIFLSNPEIPEIAASGKISYQWWEEHI